MTSKKIEQIGYANHLALNCNFGCLHSVNLLYKLKVAKVAKREDFLSHNNKILWIKIWCRVEKDKGMWQHNF
jgi:hypothetical protein